MAKVTTNIMAKAAQTSLCLASYGLVLAGFLFMPLCVRGQEEGPGIKKGADAYQKGHYGEAITDFTEALRLNPGSSASYRLRGICYVNMGDETRAIADFDKSIEIDPLYERTFLYRGSAYLSKKDYAMAIYNFSSAIDLDSRDVKAYIARGLAYYASKKNDEAIKDFDEAIQFDPQSGEAYTARSVVYTAKGFYDPAIEDCSQALELYPYNKEAYNNRGQAYAAKRDFKSAIADYEKAIGLDVKFVSAYNNLAWLLATCPQDGWRNGKKALETATRACELTQWKPGVTLDTLAAAYAEAGDFDNAVKWEKAYLGTPGLSLNSIPGANQRLALYQAKHPFHLSK